MSSFKKIVISLIITTLVFNALFQILETFQATQTVGSLPYNITGTGLTTLKTLATSPITAVVVAAMVVIGFVILYLRRENRGGV